MKIMLVCYGGFSTSILVNKMRTAIEASEKFRDRGIVIEAWGKDEYLNHCENLSIVLLGPQVSMARDAIAEELKAHGYDVPVQIISKQLYGSMNAVEVIKQAFHGVKEYRSRQ